MSILTVPTTADGIHWHAAARVEKFDLDAIAYAKKKLDVPFEPQGDALARFTTPYEVTEADGNLLTTAGLARITSLLVAGGGQAWNNANSRIGVGSSATAAAIGDTDLNAAAGAGNRQFVLSDATYPQTSNGVMTFKATHTTGLSNFHWQEWAIDEGTGNGTTVVATMMNHKVTDLGTKTSAASWAFTVTVTLS